MPEQQTCGKGLAQNAALAAKLAAEKPVKPSARGRGRSAAATEAETETARKTTAKAAQSEADIEDVLWAVARSERQASLAEIYLARGMFFVDTNQAERAIHDLTLAINLNLERTEIYTARGRAYTAMRQYDKAIEDFSQALA